MSLSRGKSRLPECGCFSAALLAFALNRNFFLALIYLTVSGFGMMLFFSTSNTVLQTIVPDEMRGRVMGVWSVVFGAMIPLGNLEAGALANWIGAPTTIALAAIICAFAGLITLLAIRRRMSLHLFSNTPSPWT